MLPFDVADYVDFYSSLEHATNLVGFFRPDAEPLLPNWRWLPVGYHGRAGTVVVSGTDVVRPSGQLGAGRGRAAFGPTRRLDFELELGFVVGVADRSSASPCRRIASRTTSSASSSSTTGARATSRRGNTSPLGPSSASRSRPRSRRWVTPLALLEDARVEAPPQDPRAAAASRGGRDWALDLALEVELNGRPRLARRTHGRSTGRCRSSSRTRPRTGRRCAPAT